MEVVVSENESQKHLRQPYREKKKKVWQAGGAEVYSLLGVWGRPSPTMASDSTNRQTHQLK